MPTDASWVVGDPTKRGKWQESVAGQDVLINLAGATIFKYWTKSHKQLVRDSRILTTRNLVEAIPRETGRNITLLSTSAVGYYGSTGDEELERTLHRIGFSRRPRSGVGSRSAQGRREGCACGDHAVRGRARQGGGALEQMILPFRYFLLVAPWVAVISGFHGFTLRTSAEQICSSRECGDSRPGEFHSARPHKKQGPCSGHWKGVGQAIVHARAWIHDALGAWRIRFGNLGRSAGGSWSALVQGLPLRLSGYGKRVEECAAD